MEEMYEYLVPLTGLFKKKRDPKILESYKQIDDIDEVVSDFKSAKSYIEGTIKVGNKCLFCKEKVTIYYIKDIAKVTFAVHGYDSTDSFSDIRLLFMDGSEKVIYKSFSTDEAVVAELLNNFQEKGIKTVIS